MIFSTHLFLFYFLPLVLALHWLLPFRWLSLLLTIVSYAFYGWSNPAWVLLMLGSSLIDYTCGLVLVRSDPGTVLGPGRGWVLLRSLPGAAGGLAFAVAAWAACSGRDPFLDAGASLFPVALAGAAAGWGFAAWCIAFLDTQGADLPRLDPARQRSRSQRLALITSLVSNLGLLAFFKYWDFGLENVDTVLRAAGLHGTGLGLIHVALPVGISFYTFQSMSYAIDVYRGEAAALRRPIDFQCYVALFPQLIAGPIVRYHTLAGQLRQRRLGWDLFARGTAFFCLGMGKKILLANPMGHVADRVFDAAAPGCIDAWYGTVAYAFQIYFDFSAYSDMAVGLGLMLGFRFLKNFDSPYHAQSITDFWRRWHISLSTWLRDYLYIPLGGNRTGTIRTYFNLALVMLLGGLWHGASWNFVIWGGIHGGMLAIERALGRESWWGRAPMVVRVAATFLVVCCAWVFFRADTLPQALAMLRAMFGAGGSDPASALVGGTIATPYHLLVFALCAGLVWGAPQAWTFTQRLTPLRAAWCLAVLAISLALLWTQTVNPFLYFQF